MGTTTLASLVQQLSENIGDSLSFTATTAINADNYIVSTDLTSFDDGEDNYFNEWWVFIADNANAGVLRKVSDYTSSSGTLTVRGVALSDDSANLAACTLHRYDRGQKKIAIQRAIEYAFPAIHRRLDDWTLTTGNYLPDGSFEWWPTSTTLTFWGSENSNLAQTTQNSYFWGDLGGTSVKVTATNWNGNVKISSFTYPRLLDLAGQTVSFYAMAYPEVADDAQLRITYTDKDGGSSETDSTTSSNAGHWSMVKITDLAIPAGISSIAFYLMVNTDTKYVYYDAAVITGQKAPLEYILPQVYQDTGHVSQVWVQTDGYSGQTGYDLHPNHWARVPFRIIQGKTYKSLWLKDGKNPYRAIRLIGYRPLTAVSAETDTIEVDGVYENAILAQAAERLYRLVQGPVSSEDKGRFHNEILWWREEYNRLVAQNTMVRPSDTMWGGR